jgi:hypothetical protein
LAVTRIKIRTAATNACWAATGLRRRSIAEAQLGGGGQNVADGLGRRAPAVGGADVRQAAVKRDVLGEAVCGFWVVVGRGEAEEDAESARGLDTL